MSLPGLIDFYWFLLVGALLSRRVDFTSRADPACLTQQPSGQYTFTVPCLQISLPNLHSSLRISMKSVVIQTFLISFFFMKCHFKTSLENQNPSCDIQHFPQSNGSAKGANLVPRRHLAMSGDTFWLLQAGKLPVVIPWVEVWDAAKQPTGHRTALHIKDYLTQNVSSTKVEKLYSKVLVIWPFFAIPC